MLSSSQSGFKSSFSLPLDQDECAFCVCVVVGQQRHEGGTIFRNAVHLQKRRRFVHMPRCCPFQCL